MANLLLYLEPEVERPESMTLWAADLLEALKAREGRRAVESLQATVVANEIDCIDLALSFLGRTDAMTIEGGERRPSGLTISAVRAPRPREESGFAESIEECMEDLHTLGLVDPTSATFQSFDDAIGRALQQPLWSQIILLAPTERIQELHNRFPSLREFIRPRMDGTFDAMVREYVDPGERNGSDEYRAWQIEAIIQALEFEALLRGVEEQC